MFQEDYSSQLTLNENAPANEEQMVLKTKAFVKQAVPEFSDLGKDKNVIISRRALPGKAERKILNSPIHRKKVKYICERFCNKCGIRIKRANRNRLRSRSHDRIIRCECGICKKCCKKKFDWTKIL